MTLNSGWKSSKVQISASTQHPWGEGILGETIPIGLGMQFLSLPVPPSCLIPTEPTPCQESRMPTPSPTDNGQGAGTPGSTPPSLCWLCTCHPHVSSSVSKAGACTSHTASCGSRVMGVRPHLPFSPCFTLWASCVRFCWKKSFPDLKHFLKYHYFSVIF